MGLCGPEGEYSVVGYQEADLSALIFVLDGHEDDSANEGATRGIARTTYLGNGINDEWRNRGGQFLG